MDAASGPASPFSLYAELLPNLGQLSVAITLPSPNDATTKVTVTHDAPNSAALHVSHRGATRAVRIPARVAAPPVMRPPADKPPATLLQFRLALAAAGGGGVGVGVGVGVGAAAVVVPWEAGVLGEGAAVRCRVCERVVVPSGRVRAWKDLPSENWAEMMEFWHCHKPGAHGHGEDTDRREGEAKKAGEEELASRGYGASSIVTAQRGVGLVDLTALWFAEEDCEGVVYSHTTAEHGAPRRDALVYTAAAAAAAAGGPPSTDPHIFCPACRAQLGHYAVGAAAATLFKWAVTVDGRARDPDALLPTAATCLAAALLAGTARTGSSRALVLPIHPHPHPHDADDVLLLQVLNGGLRCASSDAAAGRAVPAAKVLFRLVRPREAEALLASAAAAADVLELRWPPAALAEVLAALEGSRALLPPSGREFRGASVGLLPRWAG